MPDYEHIRVEADGPVTTITLNRPERLNAMPPEMAVELRDVLADPGAARCVLITGEGRAFCSGADLAAKRDRPVSGGRGAYDSLAMSYNPLMVQMAQCRVPIMLTLLVHVVAKHVADAGDDVPRGGGCSGAPTHADASAPSSGPLLRFIDL